MKERIVRLSACAVVLMSLGLSSSRSAEPERSGKTARAAGSAALFQVDPALSRAYIKVGSSGRLGHEHGVEGRLASGTIAPGAAGSLVFAMGTFQVDTPEARQRVGLTGTVSSSDQQKTNTNMLGPNVLDVARHPTATYVIEAAVPTDQQAPGEPGNYRLDGQFTLHGTTRPVPLIAQIERTTTPGLLRMRCAFAIQQSHFGITPYSTLGGLIGVADRLDIWGDLILRPLSH